MVKEFFRENWPLLAGGSVGLSLSAYALQRATGLPLLPDFSGVLSRSAAILSFIAMGATWAAGLLLSALLLYVFVVPIVNKIRNMEWERQQESVTQQQVAASLDERPIIYNGPSNALALKAERAKRKNLELLLESISTELSSLCHQVTGQQEPDAVRAIKVLGDGWSETRETMRELDAQLSEGTREAPQEPTGGAPRGATWQDVLALVEWARERDRVPMRATRDLLRKMQVQIPESETGAFSATVQALGPLPRQASGAVESKKQATDGGQAPKGQRPRTRTLPRKKLTRV